MSDLGLGAGAPGWVWPQPPPSFSPTFFQGCCTFLVLTSLLLIPIGLTNLAPKLPPLWLLLDASCRPSRRMHGGQNPRGCLLLFNCPCGMTKDFTPLLFYPPSPVFFPRGAMGDLCTGRFIPPL